MIHGFNGETVVLFPPKFRNHTMDIVVNHSRLIGTIEASTSSNFGVEFTFGGKRLNEFLTEADSFRLVPAYNINTGTVDTSPLDLIDEIA